MLRLLPGTALTVFESNKSGAIYIRAIIAVLSDSNSSSLSTSLSKNVGILVEEGRFEGLNFFSANQSGVTRFRG